jgi:hypothetical protein
MIFLTGLKTKHNVITPTPYHTILNPAVMVVQHPFQLCQQISPFYYLYICDPLARTADGNKKKKRCFNIIC